VTALAEGLQLLVALQDLDSMLREAKDKDEASKLKDMGFEVEGVEKLESAREELSQRIPQNLLNLYKRVSRRHERAVVPVTSSMCLGCFVTLPTSFTSSARMKNQIRTCESCGRILYFP
jgi:predicted  nucleic acid-binding Zn-ribbon protein